MEGIEEKSSVDLGRWFFLAAGVLVVAGIIIGGIILYRRSQSQETGVAVIPSESTSAEEEVTPIPTVEPTPTVELDRTEVSIKILNGTGIPGAAGEMAEVLEAAGWQGIKTGNADSYDYEQSVIQIKESKKDYLSLLVADLSSDYSISEETEVLAADADFDVLITLGKD